MDHNLGVGLEVLSYDPDLVWHAVLKLFDTAWPNARYDWLPIHVNQERSSEAYVFYILQILINNPELEVRFNISVLEVIIKLEFTCQLF